MQVFLQMRPKKFQSCIKQTQETIIYLGLLFRKSGFEMVTHISEISGEYCNKLLVVVLGNRNYKLNSAKRKRKIFFC